MDFRIISIIPSAENAGTELAALSTTLLFKERGFLAEIWILSDSKAFDLFTAENSLVLRKFPINCMSPFKSTISLFRLLRHTRKKRKFSVFHAYLPKPIIAMFLLKKITRVPYIAGVRGKMRKRGIFLEFLLKKALITADFVVCNASHLKENVVERFNLSGDKTLIIRNMVKLPKSLPRTDLGPIKAVVLANFIEYKGHDYLLEALQVSKSRPMVVLVGQGSREEHIRNKIQMLGLGDRVTISSDRQLEDILRSSDFAIHPSETEGFSNAILEEMSYGLPVIAFAVEGNLEVIKDNVNGLLIPLRNKMALADAIDSVTLRKEFRNRLGVAAKKTASKYSEENLFENLKSIYIRTLEQNDEKSRLHQKV